MANQLQDIVTRVYQNLSVDDDSLTYDKVTRVVPKINYVYKQIHRGEYRDILNDRTIKAGDLRFLRGKMHITDVKPTKTTADVTNITGSIPVIDTSAFPPQGYAMVNGDVFYYNLTTGTGFQSITGLLGNHPMGSTVHLVHKIPADAFRSYSLFSIGSDGKMCELSYQDYKYPCGDADYTIVGNDTTDEQFVHIPCPSAGNYRLYYHKSVGDLVNDTDTTIMPDERDLEMLAMLVSGELLRETEKGENSRMFLTSAIGKLVDYYNVFRVQKEDFRKKIKTKRPSATHVYQRTYR